MVQISLWFKNFDTSLIFSFLCLRFITNNNFYSETKENKYQTGCEHFQTKEKVKPQHAHSKCTCVGHIKTLYSNISLTLLEVIL